jgi:hypothetical protein
MNLTNNGPSAIPQFPQPGTITGGVFKKLLGHRASQTFKAAYGWLKHERENPTQLPVSRKLQMWRQGFYAESAMLYDLPRNNAHDYLSDFARATRMGDVNSHNDYFKHKLVLRSFLLAMGFRQPRTVALLYDGRILHDPFGADAQHVVPEQLLRRLSDSDGDYIVKPEDGDSGEDLFLLQSRGGQLVRRRGRETAPFDIGRLIRHSEKRQERGRTTLIEQRLEQGSFWQGLFPDTANTIALLTLWPASEPAPFLARAVQRIGTADTVPGDNWAGGGIAFSIDLTSGRLGRGRIHPHHGRQSVAGSFTRHPETQAETTGKVLPAWDRIKDTVLRAAGSLPFNRMAAWDVLVTTDGEPVIIEADGERNVNVFQTDGGLLAEPRVRRFYEETGVLGHR